MDETTRRELLHRLKIIAATSAVGYVAPKVTAIDAALAQARPCSQPPCKKPCRRPRCKKPKKPKKPK